MQDLPDVAPRAVINQISLLRCGFGRNIELFNDRAPEQTSLTARNSDNGAYHIAIYVDDIDVAASYLKSKGIRALMGPLPVNKGPAAGQFILCFFAPRGLQPEAISYPNGMAYEKDGGPVLWSDTSPTEQAD